MKLLSYTSVRYLMFAALLLLISVPVLYVLLNKIFINSVDKDLKELATEMPAQMNMIQSQRDFELWKALDNDLEIVEADKIKFHPKPFTQKKIEKGENGAEDFRVLQKKISVLGKEYVVQIESSMIEKEDLIKTILLIQSGLFFFLLLGAVGINYFINKNVWQPFYQSLTFLQRFNLENTTEESQEEPKILEFRQLKQSISQLAASTRKAYLSQKEFIENASHELQTPLTTLKFKLELQLQEKDLSQSQSLLISDMYKVIEQLDELNKNLLLLTRIENKQFASAETVSMNNVVNEVIDDLLLIAEFRSQIVYKNVPAEEVYLYSNKMLLKILVRNLVLNALQYSDTNATVHVLVNDTSIRVSNPGTPMDITADKLFSRFNKSGYGRGNGLGLSIVKAVADLYGYKISYVYSLEHHHFILQWDKCRHVQKDNSSHPFSFSSEF